MFFLKNPIYWAGPPSRGVINKYYTTSTFHDWPPSLHRLHIGTMSHELGHMMDIGDLYDIGASASGAGNGIGNYD